MAQKIVVYVQQLLCYHNSNLTIYPKYIILYTCFDNSSYLRVYQSKQKQAHKRYRNSENKIDFIIKFVTLPPKSPSSTAKPLTQPTKCAMISFVMITGVILWTQELILSDEK
jgi:hypothetical protein